MINIESQVFEKVITALETVSSSIEVKSVTTYEPSVFPCVCIEEADNNVYEQTRDSSTIENHATLMYEVNIYSNKTYGAKAECKSLLAVVDSTLADYNFTRVSAGPSPLTVDNPMKYRITARYEVVCSSGEKLFWR